MGCALLLSDINGCNEIVQHQENGMLVPVKDAVALTEAMLFIRKHPATREAYAQAIRNKIKIRLRSANAVELNFAGISILVIKKRNCSLKWERIVFTGI
jgi:glycosyltransferase involved in cell wall biosynthesis